MKAFSNFHPLVLFFYFISVLLLTMFTLHPVLLFFSLLGAVLFASMLETPRAVLVSLGFYVPMFLLIAVTNPLFSHNGVTPLFFMNDNPVTLEAILYGAAAAGMVISVMYWCRCYNTVVTSDKFLYLFGKLIPKLSLILSMALRFVPLFTAQVKKISRIQKTMGLYSSESKVDRLRGGFRVFSAIVTWSLENAVDTAASMQARGYGLPGRSNYSIYRFTPRDGAALGILAVLLGGSLWGMKTKVLEFSYYPRVAALSLTPVVLAGYAVVSALMFLPFLIEVKENLVWNYFRSKI